MLFKTCCHPSGVFPMAAPPARRLWTLDARALDDCLAGSGRQLNRVLLLSRALTQGGKRAAQNDDRNEQCSP